MNIFTYSIKSYKHKILIQLALIAGISLVTMVLTGALLIGESVTHSLEKMVISRLGKTDWLCTYGEKYFSGDLSKKIEKNSQLRVASLLKLTGNISSNGGKVRMNSVEIYGIDDNFSSFSPKTQTYPEPLENECYLNSKLAASLQTDTNSYIVLHIKKASLIPMDAPFVSADKQIVTARLKVSKILNDTEFGNFNLKNSQILPHNLFLSKRFLNKLMDLEDRANLLLIHSQHKITQKYLQGIVSKSFTLKDYQLTLDSSGLKHYIDLKSSQVFIPDTFVQAIHKIHIPYKSNSTYLINSLSKNSLSTPYSFVGTNEFLPGKSPLLKPIIISSWLAEDLHAKIGDSIWLKFYTIGESRQLNVDSSQFRVDSIFPLIKSEKDIKLMPNIPGLTDTDHCRDWDTGIPVDMKKIRKKDENYWYTFKGTPKAYISLSDAQNLWKNRFGFYTSLRFQTNKITSDDLRDKIKNALSPDIAGFQLQNIKEKSLTAAKSGVDFGELFIGLSFFLLLSCIVLSGILFNFFLENKTNEIQTLYSLGFTNRTIKKIIRNQTIISLLPAIVIGIFITFLYNKIIIRSINTLWIDIIRSSFLTIHFNAVILIKGIIFSILITIPVFWVMTNKHFARNISNQKKNNTGKSVKSPISHFFIFFILILCIIILFLLYFFQIFRNETFVFFLNGTLLLIALTYLAYIFLSKQEMKKQVPEINLFNYTTRSLVINKSRNISIIILTAIGSFILFATGANRQDINETSQKRSSGTGGFQYYAETSIPVLENLNKESTMDEFGIKDSALSTIHIVQMKVLDKDDASCLNLHRIDQASILGLNTDYFLKTGSFQFVTSLNENYNYNTWGELNRTYNNKHLVPAIADQTVIKWGLGKSVGDTLWYFNEKNEQIGLILVAGLANSIFQGKIIISDSAFRANFPTNAGNKVFLIDYPNQKEVNLTDDLSFALKKYGFTIESTTSRLIRFSSVTNTYLNIFVALGGLGLIIGTIGIGILTIKTIRERKKEFGILTALGFKKYQLIIFSFFENTYSFFYGLMVGLFAAALSVYPSLTKAQTNIPYELIVKIIALLFLNGIFWVFLSTLFTFRGKIITALRND